MRFNLGPPPTNDAIPETGVAWNLIREPQPLQSQLIAVFFGLVIAACIIFVLLSAKGIDWILNFSGLAVLLLMIPVMPVHEAIHALCFKGALTSGRVVFGFYPKALGFYAHYDGEISWYRYIVIVAAPFLLLTVMPVLIVVLFRLDYPLLTEAATANGVMSAMDLFAVIIVSKQVPRQAVLVNSGMKTWWRPTSDIPRQSDET